MGYGPMGYGLWVMALWALLVAAVTLPSYPYLDVLYIVMCNNLSPVYALMTLKLQQMTQKLTNIIKNYLTAIHVIKRSVD